MRRLLTAATIIMTLNVNAQTSFETGKDEKNGSVVYKGQVSFDDLEREETFVWFHHGASSYKPDANAVAFLKDRLHQYKIIAFMGTWCSDSHILIPQFYKVLADVNYPMGELAMYGVDRSKTTADGAHSQYGVNFVPTIILLKDGKEAGRITESTRKSVEADLVSIINKAGN